MNIQVSQQIQEEKEKEMLEIGHPIRFISTIGTLGKNRKIVNVPKKYHKDVKGLEGKEIFVEIREILLPTGESKDWVEEKSNK
jgi:hypothetical protein